MKRIEYTYVTIRYVHDPTSGESLNVGVLLCAPDVGFVRCKVDRHIRRFTETFGGFDVGLHRRALKHLQVATQRIAMQYRDGQRNLFGGLEDAEKVVRLIWPDPGAQYTSGPLIYGSTEFLEFALESAFERLVLRQQPSRPEMQSRDDEDVWNVVAPALRQQHFFTKLTERSVSTEDGPLKFEHTYQNGTIHVVQPLSFDLVGEDTLLRKAHTWFGRGDTMHRAGTFGKLLFILGKPRRPELLNEYERCRRMLERIPLRPELFEEDEVSLIETRIASFIGSP